MIESFQDASLKKSPIFYSPIQLAAISNFKLAQLTFAPPDLHSLRKTAVIKNTIEHIYSSVPAAWLQQMTRWQFFTPESLEFMTQEGLEEIFAQYAQTIDTFRTTRSSIACVDSLLQDLQDDLMEATLFSQPNSTVETTKRLSWTSDTGVVSGAVSSNLANEIMSLFDMDFSVDIKMDPAPQLPELAFKRRAKARLSQDMMASLLPAFEKIALENSNPVALPQRSSSLPRRKESSPSEMEDSQYPLSPPITPVERSDIYFKRPEEEEDEMVRKPSTSTTHSCWSFESDRKQKPLPDIPIHYQETKHKHHTKKKRKSAVVMEKTMSKRSSHGHSPNKPNFIKLGKPKKEETKKPQGLVKRMASFMKSRTKK
ncbi:hypothetical protein BY458DRAFT_456359 [Sporodiniella umbellata]|nr:hypothetical protein BY458DRAFT_456359 [Sporodiniella umbellata]